MDGCKSTNKKSRVVANKHRGADGRGVEVLGFCLGVLPPKVCGTKKRRRVVATQGGTNANVSVLRSFVWHEEKYQHVIISGNREGGDGCKKKLCVHSVADHTTGTDWVHVTEGISNTGTR